MENKITKLLNEKVGHLGRMISYSKSTYSIKNPDNFVVFNANICTATERVWWGDLDLTLSKESLISAAVEANEDIYVFYELDVSLEDTFNVNDAVVIFHGDGTYEVNRKYKGYRKL